jgi:hypothetical protein
MVVYVLWAVDASPRWKLCESTANPTFVRDLNVEREDDG